MKDHFRTKINAFKSSVGDLREKMQKLLKMCDNIDFKQNEAFDTLQDGLINLVEIKNSNSEIQKELETFKEFTTKEKEKLEDRNLNYQNYLYQKENIISQINACINFPTVEMNKINLPSKNNVDEYYNKKGIPTENNDLKTMDILQCELEMRKELNEKVKSLGEIKEENSLTLKEKDKFIKEMPKYFTDLEVDSLKAQKFLNLGVTEKNENTSLSEKLPASLYILYNSLLCIDQKINYQIKILGRINEVDDFYQSYPLDNINFNEDSNEMGTDLREEGEHSDDGEINEEEDEEKTSEKVPQLTKIRLMRRRNKRGRNEDDFNWKLNYNSDKFPNTPKIKKCPLYVQLNILSGDGIDAYNYNFTNNVFPITINFYYLPIFNVITVEALSKNTNFNTNTLLSNIFMPPTNLLSELKDQINSAIAYLCVDFSPNEKFFDYLQYLGNNYNYNLSYLNKLSEKILQKEKKRSGNPNDEYHLDDPHKITIDNFILNLFNRLTFLPHLFTQLEYLSNNKRISGDVTAEFQKDKKINITKEKINIIEFSKISQEEYLHVFQSTFIDSEENFCLNNFTIISIYEKDEEGNYIKRYVKVPLTIYDSEEAFYYKIEFERRSMRIDAYIEIGYDYPINNPKFILNVIHNKSKTELGEFDTAKIPSNLKQYVSEENKNFASEKNINAEMNNVLRSIEKEVNNFFYEFCAESNRKYLLSYQIKIIQMCLDIVFNSEASNSTGKHMKRPFSFNEIKNLYAIR